MRIVKANKTSNPSNTRKHPRGARLFIALFALTSFFPVVSYSQTIIEEIIVTARKREESLQDIPLTVNAFTESALEDRGITSLNSLADATPGFDFAQGFGRQDFRPAIRGQSTIQGRANAGLFIDGIIIERGPATVPLSALERVEIVKGPQSALYGRSTLAGAINYVLKKPAEELEGEFSLEAGQRGYLRAEGHVSGPLGDAAGFALTLARYQRDGEYPNRLDANTLGTPAIDDKVGGEESSSAVAVFTFSPTDALRATAHAIYERTTDDQYAMALQPASANNCFITGARNPNRSTGADGQPLSQPPPPADTPEADANNVNSAGYNGSGYYCGRVDVGDVLAENGGAASLETSFYDDPGVANKSLRLGFKLEYDLTDAITLTSITGYNKYDSKTREDQTFGGGDTRFPVVGVRSPFAVQGFGAPLSVEARVGFITAGRDKFDDFSQELRLKYDGDALRLLGGAYYYTSDDEDASLNTSVDTTSQVSVAGVPVFSPFSRTFARANISTSAFFEGAPGVNGGKNKIESWSVFGQMEYDFTDTLTVGAEFRYNKDTFKFNRAEPEVNAKDSFSKILPKAIVRYQPADDLNLYASVARGNKPGGLNTQEGTPAADVPYDEESAWNYELGAKSLWLDDRLRANVAIYYIDWKDQQLTTTRAARVGNDDRTFSILENIGESTIMGLEAELAFDVTDFWNVYLGYALTDSEIDEFIQSVDADANAPSTFREAALIFGYQPSGDVLISGTQLPQTSKHQLNLSNTFTGDFSADMSWFLRADYNYNSKRYAQVYNEAHTGSREIVNLRLGLRSERFDLELWANNLLDNDTSPALIRYVQGSDGTFNPFNRAIGLTLPDERRLGVTARYRF